jgi:hypothetical protein
MLTEHGVVARIPGETGMGVSERADQCEARTHHSTKSTCGDCVTHVTSTLGDVPFTRSVLKSELRSFTLQKRREAARKARRRARMSHSMNNELLARVHAPIDTAEHGREPFWPEILGEGETGACAGG